ncbi:phage portal protein family protein [Psychrobacter pygoscelis]|uniref:phage portal protein family protein n=1 Tax=Psychrobacter pygoscelis TaxID=2488563 RepID=UPI00103FB037|nr:DUF935 family protein [Psychrobacter pygoscelis]
MARLISRLTSALARTAQPVSTAVKRVVATTGGDLISEQATSQYNDFFDNIVRVDTDEVLKKVGISRHHLETLLFDDEIDYHVERRFENLTQAGYILSPSEGEAADFIYSQLDMHLEPLLTAALNAKLYGYSVCELVWTSTERAKVIKTYIGKDEYGKDQYSYDYNGRSITKEQYDGLFNVGFVYPEIIVEKPMEWFEPKHGGRLLWFPETYGQPVEVDTKYRFLLQQHRPTYKNPKGKAILSRVYWLWYFKKSGWQFWSKFLERFGAPLLIGTTQGDTNALVDALATAHNQSIVAMPDGDDVKAIAASGNGEAFKAYDEAINKRIAKYISGQTLTSGTDGGGTYGQGKVHQDQQEIVFGSDKKFATKYVQRIIDVICEVNGFESVEFEFKIEKGLQTDRAERDEKLTRQGVNFSKDYYVDTYDIREEYIQGVSESSPVVPAIDMSAKKMGFRADTTAPINPVTQYTPEQQELEKLADYALDNAQSPLPMDRLLSAMRDANDESELAEKLTAIVGSDIVGSDFALLTEAYLKASSLHGVVDEHSEPDDD